MSDTYWNTFLRADIGLVDPDTDAIIGYEEERQARKLILIPSESMTPLAVRQALGSVFNSIYAEGYPPLRMTREDEETILDFDHELAYYRRYGDRRFYKGVDYVHFVETLAQRRCAAAFANTAVPAENIYVNVQPLSGAAANLAVYDALVEAGDTVMGMDLYQGGHLTHGSQFNFSGKRYRVVSYGVSPTTGRLDYDHIRDLARRHRPKMIIAGFTSYPWAPDWRAFAEISHEVGGRLLADISHPAGMVAAGAFPSPIGIADVITFTTHKTLCGPRGAVIMSTDEELAGRIDMAVFPGEQGGPHPHKFAAMCVMFKIAQSDAFRRMMFGIKENAAALAAGLTKRGLGLAYGGTDSHFCVLDLNSVGTHVHEGGRKGSPLRGEPAVRILDLAGIVANKNTIPGDTQTSLAMGIRLGTPWLTQRGFGPAEMDQVAGLIHKTVAAIQPFSYMGLAGELPRGKIDLDTFEEIKADVAALAAKGAAETEDRGTGYPHYYVLGDPKGFQKPFGSGPGLEAELKAAHEAAVVMAPPGGLLLVTGERAEAALAQIVTSDVAGLAPGRTQSGFILDKDGVVLDDVFVMRLPPDERGRDRFFLRTHVENHARVAAWLRGLGDGYTLFDPADLFAKVEGPIIVEDVSHSQTFEVSETSKVFKPHIQISEVSETSKVFKPHIQTFEVSETSEVFKPHIQTSEVSETSKVFIPLIVHGPAGLATVHAANLSGIHVFAGGHGHAELIVPAAQAQTVYDRLVAAGATPAGEETFAALRRRSGLPDYSQFRGFGPGSDRPTGLDLHRVAPHRFELRKPYFVGQHILAHLRAAQSTALPIYQSTNPQSTNPPTHRTPLYAWHKAHTRHIVPFAGWEMPVWYTGVLDEHNAVRKRAGLFDVAHMGVFEVSGPHAVEFLDLVCTNYVRWYAAGESFYTYLLDPDGKVIDDLLVYRRRADLFQIVVNAANADKDWAWLNAVNNGEALLDRGRPDLRVLRPATIRNLKDPASGADMRVDLALQGPASLRILQSLADDPRLADRLGRVRKTGLIECTLSGPSTGSGRGFDLIIARTGYTGEEIGYEIFVHPDRAVALWERLLEAGKPFGIQPTALAARDSTRTEAGLPLYGHELAGPFDISPAGAGFPGYVKLHKPYFIGRAAYIAAESQRTMEIARFRMNERGVRMPKTGDPVVNRRGQAIGWVASAAVDVDGLILGLAYIQSRYHKQGDQIGVFALPAKPLVEKANKADLAPGDKVSLPDAATLLRRFPDKAERAHWRGGPSAGALAAPPVSE